MKSSNKKLDSGKSSAVSGGVKPTAKQRKAKFRKLLTQYSITHARN